MLAFLGIGAQKAGTTWLHHWLARHPCIGFPAGKEAHFWNDRRGRPVETYRQMFAVDDGKLHGDFTPAYALLNAASTREIREHFPEVKLIYCLRDPRARAWSAALMALHRAEMTEEEASDRWFIDHFCSAGSRRRGDYETCLHAWLAHFPPERLLVIRLESIATVPRVVLKAAASHIGADPAFFDTPREEMLRSKIFAGSRAELRPSLVPVLEELYPDARVRLAAFLKGLPCPSI
jgi:hypothetical protein